MKLSIIIPTYNEADNIEELLSRIQKSLRGYEFEIVVVDDNSPDGTAEIVEKFGKKFKNVKVIKRPGKLGLSSAIVDGIKHSRGDIIAVMDADLQHPPEVLPIMLEKIKSADLVIASRYVEGGKCNGLGFLRKVVSKGAIFLSHLVLPSTRSIKDPISGFFMIKRRCLPKELNPIGYKILLDIIVNGKFNRIEEIPYSFERRSKGSSKIGFSEILNYIRLILKLSDYRVIKFGIVGLSGIIVNMLVLYILHSVFNIDVAIAGMLAIESSIIHNFVLNDMWTFKNRKVNGFTARLIKYHIAVAIGALINLTTLITLTYMGVNYLVANMLGIIFGFLANYIGGEIFVWSKQKTLY